MRYFFLYSLLVAGMATSGLALAAAATSADVRCHYTYGGETKTLSVRATRQPYTLAPVPVGSYFLLRVVAEAAPVPAVKIYTYANLDEGPVPIHVASYPWPAQRQRRAPGFTGYQYVYEPVRDGELQYWCERI